MQGDANVVVSKGTLDREARIGETGHKSVSRGVRRAARRSAA